ncbi:MAG: hypothetical protein OXE74_07865, partial [Cyanobacteria bacterium MAG CAR2_bin_4]|nr:hypothetical protein [Cyanobacteria bacterium MAG CAR2_bin_4]
MSSVRSAGQFPGAPLSHLGPGIVSRTSIQTRVSFPSSVLTACPASARTFGVVAPVDTPCSQFQYAQLDGVTHDAPMVMETWGGSSSFSAT